MYTQSHHPNVAVCTHVPQSLVSAKLQLAQVSEREVISKRELYKAKETNMKLASKMTKLETLVYK